MEQLGRIGKVLGSLKALMVFRDNIQINQRQCCLLLDIFSLAYDSIAEEMRQNLRFEERHIKWKVLEQPLRELHRIFREGEAYIRQSLETKDWWAKAITLYQNTDCVELYIHNLLSCIPVVIEAIEIAAESSGWDHDEMQKKRLVYSNKYQKEWKDHKVFQWKFAKQYIVTPDLSNRMDTVWQEDRWILLNKIQQKKMSGSTKQERQLVELLFKTINGSEPLCGRLLPSKILVKSEDYQVRRRLGSGSQYKEILWLGESFALRHFFGDIEPIFPQIARGMEYLHSKKIYHGDLSPSNILVKSRSTSTEGYLHAKVSGFGLSSVKNFTQRSPSSPNGTLSFIWHAPEVLEEQEQTGSTENSKYREKSDVYSFGMVCFELLTGKVPFEDAHLQGDKMSRNIRAGERPLFPFHAPKYVTNLTKRCWHADPNQRPSFTSICRILRYIKRFLLLNPDYNIQPDPPMPQMDYCEIESRLSKEFASWETPNLLLPISEIPFQMFVYRIVEKEKTCGGSMKDLSESGSDRASVSGDENMTTPDEPFPPVTPVTEKKRLPSPETMTKRLSMLKKSSEGKANKSGTPKGRSVRPPQIIPCGRSLRMNSESQLMAMMSPRMSPRLRRSSSGHMSDSELSSRH
ncbi:hypothetical protein LWI29_024307 [Acer saccharum]|uniref:Protein kinase domain-containing protein n=1 Tax=Acer saccharum TaxID=4024 RepID=A0AA39RW76_ACESA|nr:hypothetical protein LWI29_024307 [Acer saccharum]